MSRTAFIGFKDAGFWAYDVPTAAFLKFLIDAASERYASVSEPWLAEAIRRWRVCAVVTDYGVELNDAWTPAQIDTVVQLCRRASDTIRAGGDIAASDVEAEPILEDLHIFLRGHDPIPAEPVARFGDAITQLLQNRFPPAPDGHRWFYTLEAEVETLASK